MGIPAFYTPAGVGTLVADGGLPWRFDTDGTVLVSSPPKEQRSFDPDGRGERLPSSPRRSRLTPFISFAPAVQMVCTATTSIANAA